MALPFPTPLETGAANLPACMSQEQAVAEQLTSRVQPPFQKLCGDKIACGVFKPQTATDRASPDQSSCLVKHNSALPWLYSGDALHCCTAFHTFWLNKKSGYCTNPFHSNGNFINFKKQLSCTFKEVFLART